MNSSPPQSTPRGLRSGVGRQAKMSDDAWAWLGTGGGAAGALMREVDWAATPVGPVETWPTELKSIVSMMLYARQPMFLWWGAELIQFYNDGYTPSFGAGRHPKAIGQRGKECWAEIWPTIGPEIEGVIARREATFHDDALVPIFRNGRMEEVYWTYGYSPVFDGNGSVAGVLVVVTETTARVIAMRRLKTSRRLADALALAHHPADLLRHAIDALEHAGDDVPWAFAFDSATGDVLAQTPNLGALAAAEVTKHVRACTESRRPIELPVNGLPGGPWPEPGAHAAIVPLGQREDKVTEGILVIGLSPRLPFDMAYEQHVLDIARMLDEAGQRIASWAARVAAERSRADLLLHAPVPAALLVGPQWRYELANQAYVDLVGREVVGRHWHECFPELEGSEVEAILQRVYTQGEAISTSEQLIPLVRKSDGVVEERYFDFNTVPVRSRDGGVDAMMVVAVEFTAQVRARRDLERTAVEREALVRELRAASRTKDEFVAMLGQELRNPLAPIATALGMMEMRGVTGIDREREVIARQVRHLTRLVDDLLDVARLASDKIKLTFKEQDVLAIVAHALESAEPLIEARGQHVHLMVPSGFRVNADVGRLTQVLSNLLTNASKYSNADTEILVRAEKRGDSVVISVRDQGVGIDAEMLPRVFDLFSQERQSLARSAGGLGLGLAIVRNLVLMHGGTVTAESAGRNQGSTFSVILPLSENRFSPEVDPAQVMGPSVARSLAIRRVLIVATTATLPI